MERQQAIMTDSIDTGLAMNFSIFEGEPFQTWRDFFKCILATVTNHFGMCPESDLPV
jgi:hypothetical protein